MSKNEIMVFSNEKFGNIRSVTINGEPWLVGKDVATALGYSNTKDALSKHVDLEDKMMGSQNTTPSIRDNMGREQHPTFINESGLYSLIMGSKLPSAREFKRWVTSEVLPSIRKTGSYSNPKHRPMTEYQERLSRIREKDMNNKSAALWVKMGEVYDDDMMKQICFAHASKELSGEFAIPLPVLPEKTYSAGEIGDILGISANAVGRLANANGLKQDSYGKWFADKAKSADKAVQTFRYYGKVIPLLRNLVNKEVES